HIERRDCFWQLLARVGCALYWWNPLVWRGARQLRIAGEQAADDRALASGGRVAAAEYAGHLLASARALRASRVRLSSPAAMSYCSPLEGRIRAILDPLRRRAPLGRRATAGVAALLAAAVLPLAAVRLVPVPARAQDLPRFEAASVRPAGPVSGEPGWFRSELFSIDAVTAGPTTGAQKLLMLRRLLAERFQLQLRQDSRPQPVYFLEIAPGGPNFQPLPPGEPQPKNPPSTPGTFARSFDTIAILVANLNSLYGGPLHMDRTVVDRTGLTGRYHMYLSTAMEMPEQPGAHRQFPNLQADIQSQLGLRLVPTRAPLPAYIVVHAARPTPN